MRILVAPDSFKGSLSAQQFCEVVKAVVRAQLPDAEVIAAPLADGGEGTLPLLVRACGGYTATVRVPSPLMLPSEQPIEAQVGFFTRENGSKVAVVECAQAAGLPLVKGREDAEATSTFGVGVMMRFAAEQGADEILLTLGGSATNDGGAGMLCALGVAFYRADGSRFLPTGGSLCEIARIEPNAAPIDGKPFALSALNNIAVTVMCDVQNPLLGETGCAAVFAPQKGADADAVERLERGMAHYADRLHRVFPDADPALPGAGAAGGLGYAAAGVLGGTLKSGIDVLLESYAFDSLVEKADVILTGEGRFDEQSLMGKVISGITARAGNTPVVVFCGQKQAVDLRNCPSIREVIAISEGVPKQQAMENAAYYLEAALKAWIDRSTKSQ